MRGRVYGFGLGPVCLAILGGLSLWCGTRPADARITSLTYTTSESYATQSFGSVGQYQELDGTATGELDPRDTLNAIMTDIDLAPRSHGKVQYSFTFSILEPVDLSKSNHTLLYDIVNRGNKVITGWNNVVPSPATDFSKTRATFLSGAAGRATCSPRSDASSSIRR
jgi:hypothetical protein